MNKLIKKYRNSPVQVRASFWFLICTFLQKGISMLTTPIFTRLLSTEEYGQYGVFNSWLSIVTILVSMNLSLGVYTQGLVKFDDERKQFSSSLQGLSLTLVSVWTVVYVAFHDFWNQLFTLTTVQMLAMLVMIWATASFNFWAAAQRVSYRYRALVIVTLLVSVSKPLFGILFVIHATDKVTARVLGLALVELVGYSWCFFVQQRAGKKFFYGKFWKYAVLYNLPLIPHYLSQTVLNNSDRIMIRQLSGKSAAGIYTLSYSLAMIMTLFNTAMMQTLSPWIYQKIKAKDIKGIAPVAYISLGIVALVNILLIMLAPEAVAIFAPKSYHEAIYCIPPVAMGVLFLYAYDLFAKFAFYYEKTTMIMVASVSGAVLNVVLNYFGIKMFGYIAAAYTTLICYICYDIFHFTLMTKICNRYLDGEKPYNLKYLLIIAGVFLLIGFTMLFTYRYPILRYSIIAATAFVLILKRNMIKDALQKVFSLRKKKKA